MLRVEDTPTCDAAWGRRRTGSPLEVHDVPSSPRSVPPPCPFTVLGAPPPSCAPYRRARRDRPCPPVRALVRRRRSRSRPPLCARGPDRGDGPGPSRRPQASATSPHHRLSPGPGRSRSGRVLPLGVPAPAAEPAGPAGGRLLGWLLAWFLVSLTGTALAGGLTFLKTAGSCRASFWLPSRPLARRTPGTPGNRLAALAGLYSSPRSPSWAR